MKIVMVQGVPYQECMWSKTLMTSRYGVKKSNGDREGAFVNAACAFAYYTLQLKNSKIDAEKFKKICSNIIDDLNLVGKGRNLVAAPFINPANPDWKWMEKCPWMENNSLNILATDDYRMKQEKKNQKLQKNPAAVSKKFYIYTITPKSNPDGCEVSQGLFDIKRKILLKTHMERIYFGTYRTREITIIESNSNKNLENSLVNSMVQSIDQDEPPFSGVCYIISKKELPLQKEEEGSESSEEKKKKNNVNPQRVKLNEEIEKIISENVCDGLGDDFTPFGTKTAKQIKNEKKKNSEVPIKKRKIDVK